MDKKSSPLFHRVFYFLLHSVFTICKTIEKVLAKGKIKLVRHELTRTNKQLVRLDKIPKHLTVLLTPEQPSLKDLANLVLWCLAANITFVSFYDREGTLKKNQDKLQSAVERNKTASDRVTWHRGAPGGTKNGSTGRNIHVKVLSEEDGRGGVVDLTKKLASSGVLDADISRFDRGLREQFEFPDPDLGLCCGEAFSMYGYPPWQSRVTEFIHITTHHDFTFERFVELLRCYGKCEQRYGK